MFLLLFYRLWFAQVFLVDKHHLLPVEVKIPSLILHTDRCKWTGFNLVTSPCNRLVSCLLIPWPWTIHWGNCLCLILLYTQTRPLDEGTVHLSGSRRNDSTMLRMFDSLNVKKWCVLIDYTARALINSTLKLYKLDPLSPLLILLDCVQGQAYKRGSNDCWFICIHRRRGTNLKRKLSLLGLFCWMDLTA